MRKADVAPRLEYYVFPLSAPTRNGKERLTRARIELSRKYPCEPDAGSLFFVRNGRKRDFWICIVWASRNMQKNYVMSTLFVMERFPSHTGNVCLVSSDFIEYVVLDNGSLVSSVAERRNVDESAESQIQRFYGDDMDFKTVSFPPESDVSSRVLFRSDNKKERRIMILLVAAAAVLCTVISLKSFSSYSRRMLEEAEQKRLFEAEQKKRVEAASLLRKQVEEARNAYIKMEGERRGDIYLMASVIYDCLGKDARISSLSMSGRKFELELYTDDSVELLSRFEKSRFIDGVRMNRSVKDGRREYVSFSGSVSRYIPFPDESLSDEEKLLYYRNALNAGAEEAERRASMSVSGYAADMRKLFAEADCKEDYMQLKPNDDYAGLECFLKSGGSNIFDFLMNAEKHDPPVDFLSVRIKNSDGGNIVSSVVNVNTGIRMESLKDEFSYTDKELENLSFTPVQIGRAFGPASEKAVRPAASLKSVKPAVSKPAPVSPKAPELSLVYVGEGKTTARGKHVFFKDSKDDVMYSLPLSKGAPGVSDWCSEKGSGAYEVHLNGRVYEVRR